MQPLGVGIWPLPHFCCCQCSCAKVGVTEKKISSSAMLDFMAHLHCCWASLSMFYCLYDCIVAAGCSESKDPKIVNPPALGISYLTAISMCLLVAVPSHGPDR